MSEPKWLDYAGQTTDQLLALAGEYRVDSLVCAFEEALAHKELAFGIGGLSAEERVVLAVEALEREVNNGGFDQLFTNRSKEWVPELVASLQAVGCGAVAELTQEAIDALGIEGPLTVASIDAAMAQDGEARDDKLADCDDRYYDEAGDLSGPVFDYIKAHHAEISLT
jgi:hypothetical protein